MACVGVDKVFVDKLAREKVGRHEAGAGVELGLVILLLKRVMALTAFIG